jgi:uncharacterized membrane protein YfhO
VEVRLKKWGNSNCYPLDNYAKQVNALKEDVLTNVKLGVNRVSGTIDLKQDKILLLTIPFSPGWTATVDGVQQKLLNANTAFMALPLSKGVHEIHLSYFTPGLKAGLVLSALGWVIFLILLFQKFARN